MHEIYANIARLLKSSQLMCSLYLNGNTYSTYIVVYYVSNVLVYLCLYTKEHYIFVIIFPCAYFTEQGSVFCSMK